MLAADLAANCGARAADQHSLTCPVPKIKVSQVCSPGGVDRCVREIKASGYDARMTAPTMSRAGRARWQYGHVPKVIYRKRWRAERRRWQVYLAERNWLQVYSCRWTHRLSAGETGEPHWHLGHGKGAYGPLERVRHLWRRLVLWRYYRLRHRYRVARGRSGCTSPGCKAHGLRA